MTPEPQWHDFPFKGGLYALLCNGFTVVTRIHTIDGLWFYRNEGHAYSYPFEAELFNGKCYGPIELPQMP